MINHLLADSEHNLPEHDQVICDSSSIVLRDHSCLYPGYLEIKDGQLFQHFSDDPNNTITGPNDPRWNKFVGEDRMLQNRLDFERVNGPFTPPVGAPTNGHFISWQALMEFIAQHPQTQPVETTIEPAMKTETVEEHPTNETTITPQTEPEIPTVCPVCGYSSDTPNLMVVHLASHTLQTAPESANQLLVEEQTIPEPQIASPEMPPESPSSSESNGLDQDRRLNLDTQDPVTQGGEQLTPPTEVTTPTDEAKVPFCALCEDNIKVPHLCPRLGGQLAN